VHREEISNMNAKNQNRARVLVGVCGLAASALALTGCNARSFLDPSKTVRSEPTATIMPILDRIAAIEDDSGQVVEYSDPLAEDLIPEPQSYRISPGDVLRVVIFDFISPGRPEEYEVPVDARGMVEIPQLGRVNVAGRTTEEATQVFVQTIRDKGLVDEPLVQVLAVAQRGQTFTIIGAVQNPGLFPIPKADYRILEALSAGGNFDESTKEVYIIRQVPLSDEVMGGIPTRAQPVPDAGSQSQPAPSAEDLINLIEGIAPPETAPNQQPEQPQDMLRDEKTAPPGAPGAMRETPRAAPRTAPSRRRQDSAPDENTPPQRPAVDLIETDTGPTPGAPAGDGSSWLFLNGKWVKVKSQDTGDTNAPSSTRIDELITQRVIRIPLKPLLEGKQSINVVIRPGDVIRLPSQGSGFVYMGGEVARPGPYQVAADFTLLRAIDSAGGLSEIGIPERLELTRLLPGNRQAVINLDLQAISQFTQPDVYLKAGDRVRVGTNFWALPLAVTRNGFRASYGFGFILDRNLSSDVFGPPPVNQFGQ
jgi:polysaccharide export outer membrane protein